MAFLASNVLPAVAYADLKREAVRLKSYCQAKASQLSTDTDADQITRVLADLKSFEDNFARFTGVEGLSAYAVAQESDANYDVVAEFQALTTAVASVKSWVVNNFPKDPNGYILGWGFHAETGQVTPRVFTAAQVSTLRTNLLAVSNLVV